jgi:hypothetical protein
MAFIGNTQTSIPFITDSFSGNASATSFSPLTRAPAGTASIAVFVAGAYQAPSTYSLVGTTITFGSPPASGVGNIIILHLGNGSTTQVPSDGSVTLLKLSGETFGYINTAFTAANTPSYTANSAASYANAAFATANTITSASSYANSAFSSANNGVGVDTTQNTNITAASTYANSAFSKANNALTAASNTSTSVQLGSLGIGTAASGTTGEIRATDNITAYYSDDRLKTRLGTIENALDKVKNLTGFYYEANDLAQSLGYKVRREVGLSAQDMQKQFPEIVTTAPIDDKYLTIWYEKTAPLLVEAIKELANQVEEIKKTITSK